MLKTARKAKQQKPQYAIRIISELKKRNLSHVVDLSTHQLCQFQQGLKLLIEKSSSSSRKFQIYRAMLHHVNQNLQALANVKGYQIQYSEQQKKQRQYQLAQHKTSDSFSNVQGQTKFKQLSSKISIQNQSQKRLNSKVSFGSRQLQMDGFKNLRSLFRPIQILFKKQQFKKCVQEEPYDNKRMCSFDNQKKQEQKKQILFSVQQSVQIENIQYKLSISKNNRAKFKLQ